MNTDRLSKLTITRSPNKPTIEIYFEGEFVGRIDLETKGAHRIIVRIAAMKFLRFVRAEIDEERKQKTIFPDRPKPGSKP